MKRPLVIHGSDPEVLRRVAGAVATMAALPLEDLVGGSLTSEGLERRLADGSPRVVATQSDTLGERSARLRVLEQAVVVSIAAHPVPADCEAHVLVDLGAGSIEEAGNRVVVTWRRDPLAVAAGERSYLVEVGAGVLESRIRELAGSAPVVLLVTDANVEPLHAHRVTRPLGGCCRLLGHVLKPGEKSKILRTLVQLWNVALEGGADRSSVFVGLGGGVVTDVTGFAAATWMRGVRWLALPTTLLAMVDASVGGKTGVDLRSAKNAVGAFWQPAAVVCDIDTLQTEPRRGFTSALAEVVKTALIGDPDLFELLDRDTEQVLARDPALLEQIVRRCVMVKARVVGLDEREGGLRAVLNLGHTVGHALEAHSDFELTHGEAVSLGLVAACRIGERVGGTPADLSARVVSLLARLGLPTDVGSRDLAGASTLIGHDKKRVGSRVRFVVVRRPGCVETVPLELEQLRGLARDLG